MYLYSSKGFGGIVRNLSLLVNHLNKESFSAVVVALTNAGDKGCDITLNSESATVYYRIDETRTLDFEAIRKIRDFIIQHKIDILSCHGYKADFYGFLLSRFYKCKVKLITMAHGWVTPGFKFQLYYILDKFVMRYFDRIILVSQGLHKEASIFRIPQRKIVVIENAINFTDFKKNLNCEALRQEFGFKLEDSIIGFVGRLSREKNIKTTLFAVKEASQLLKNLKLLIAGDGPQKGELMHLAKKLNINSQVVFADYQKDTKKIYSLLDLYVSASVKEGLPNSILEALAYGVVCIATDISGNNDIIKDEVNGFLFKPKDFKTLSQKIITLLKDKNLADRFIAAGYAVLQHRFSLRQRMAKLENLYFEVMEN